MREAARGLPTAVCSAAVAGWRGGVGSSLPSNPSDEFGDSEAESSAPMPCVEMPPPQPTHHVVKQKTRHTGRAEQRGLRHHYESACSSRLTSGRRSEGRPHMPAGASVDTRSRLRAACDLQISDCL